MTTSRGRPWQRVRRRPPRRSTVGAAAARCARCRPRISTGTVARSSKRSRRSRRRWRRQRRQPAPPLLRPRRARSGRGRARKPRASCCRRRWRSQKRQLPQRPRQPPVRVRALRSLNRSPPSRLMWVARRYAPRFAAQPQRTRQGLQPLPPPRLHVQRPRAAPRSRRHLRVPAPASTSYLKKGVAAGAPRPQRCSPPPLNSVRDGARPSRLRPPRPRRRSPRRSRPLQGTPLQLQALTMPSASRRPLGAARAAAERPLLRRAWTAAATLARPCRDCHPRRSALPTPSATRRRTVRCTQRAAA